MIKVYPEKYEVNTISGEKFYILPERIESFMRDVEMKKFIQIKDCLVATHQITTVMAHRRLKNVLYLSDVLPVDLLAEQIYYSNMSPDEATQYLEKIRNAYGEDVATECSYLIEQRNNVLSLDAPQYE